MKALLLYVTVLILGSSLAVTQSAAYPPDAALQAVNNKALALAIRAQELYDVPVESRPRVIVQKEIRGYDGWADCQYNYIELDGGLLRSHPQFVLDVVLPHEFAHIVMCHVTDFKSAGPFHGEQWGEISKSLGGKPYNHAKRSRT